MPPVRLNRRRFLGCSAAAGWALAQGVGVEGEENHPPVRLGLIGLGNRGTALLRTALELPGAPVIAVCDAEPKHLKRAQGIAEKAQKHRPEAYESHAKLLEREDLDAVLVALPCDLHAAVYCDALRARKHLYAEKPLAPTLAECDLVIAEAARAPELAVHVGFQRRSNPRYRMAVELVKRGELGELISGAASWCSSNGPLNGHGGWLAERARSGDWMVEQAVHVWDVFHWLTGSMPARAYGQGKRNLFAAEQPTRDVTDHYVAHLEWPSGFHLTFEQSWVAPADDHFTGSTQRLLGTAGGLDFSSGTIIPRDRSQPRQVLHPGTPHDTRMALEAFLAAARSEEPLPPPVSLAEAREATLTGLLARRAVDEGRSVAASELAG